VAHANVVVDESLRRAVVGAVGPFKALVALGGGADSAALLAVATAALDPGAVRAAFVHHGLPSSAALEAAAMALCEELGVDLTVLEGEVDEGPDLEARAREARYRSLLDNRREGELLLTAHTEDDQAETILMRLTQGAGATGLAGIPASRDAIRRPVILFSKDALEQEAMRLGLTYIADPANEDQRFTRNRVRHVVMPTLEAEIAATAREGLARSARLIAQDDALIADLAAQIPVITRGQRVLIPIGPLVTAPAPIATRAIRAALRHVNDGYPGTSAEVEAVLDVASSGVTRSLTSSNLAVSEAGHVAIGPLPTAEAPRTLATSGVTKWNGNTYVTTIVPGPPTHLRGGRFTVMDAAAVGEQLVIRGAEDGDRIDTGEGTTPVAEVMRAAGIPATLRAASPVIAVDANIAAVVGVRTAAWAAQGSGASIVVERKVSP